VQLGYLASCALVLRVNYGVVDGGVAHGRLLTRALLGHDGGARVAVRALVDALDSREQLGVHWLNARAIYSLNRALHLALINLFKHVQRGVRDFGARRTFSVGLGRRLRRSVRRRLVRRRRLLVYPALREHVVQIRALIIVVDNLKLLFLAAREYGLGAACVQVRWTMRLGIVAAFYLAIRVTGANEVVDAQDFHLRRVALARTRAAVLADAAPLEAPIEELLLPLELVLQFSYLGLLYLHQFLEATFELLLKLCLFLLISCLPVFFLLLEVVDLLLEHLDVQLQLLLDFDVVTHLRLVVLELLLVLLGWEVEGVEGAGELARRPVVHVEAPWAVLVLPASCVFLLLQSELHEVLKLGLNIGENGETGQVAQARALVSQLLRLNHIDLRQDTQIK